MQEVLIPHCIGQFDNKDLECSGDPNSESKKGKMSCGWYVRCMHLRKHLQRSKRKVTDYFEVGAERRGCYAVPKEGYTKFIKFCDAIVLAARRGPQAAPKPESKKKKIGRPKIDKRYKGPTAKVKKAAKLALQAIAKENSAALYEMLEQFKVDLVAAIGGGISFPKNSIVRPGNLYVVDRVESSGYLTIRCKTKDTRDCPVVMLRTKPSKLAFDVAFPATVDEVKATMSEETKKIFSPMRKIDSGAFRSESIGKIDKQGLFLLALVLAKLASRGVINLPKRKTAE